MIRDGAEQRGELSNNTKSLSTTSERGDAITTPTAFFLLALSLLNVPPILALYMVGIIAVATQVATLHVYECLRE